MALRMSRARGLLLLLGLLPPLSSRVCANDLVCATLHNACVAVLDAPSTAKPCSGHRTYGAGRNERYCRKHRPLRIDVYGPHGALSAERLKHD
jgi:hypothetical protein